jgi:hypothetical protein
MEMGLHVVLVVLDRGFFHKFHGKEVGLGTVTTVPMSPCLLSILA